MEKVAKEFLIPNQREMDLHNGRYVSNEAFYCLRITHTRVNQVPLCNIDQSSATDYGCQGSFWCKGKFFGDIFEKLVLVIFEEETSRGFSSSRGLRDFSSSRAELLAFCTRSPNLKRDRTGTNPTSDSAVAKAEVAPLAKMAGPQSICLSLSTERDRRPRGTASSLSS